MEPALLQEVIELGAKLAIIIVEFVRRERERAEGDGHVFNALFFQTKYSAPVFGPT